MAPDTIEAYDGTEVDVDVIKPLSGGGARVEIDAVDGARWRLDVTSTGELSEVVTSWNSEGELADKEVPDWVDDILLRLARA
jgi:hypothetical protein